MTIAFNQVPNGTLVPFFYVEFDNSVASSGSNLVPWQVLLIGQKTSAGTATAGKLYEITADGQATTLGGDGSQVAREGEAYRSKPGRVRMWILPLDDDATAVARVVTVTYSDGGSGATGSGSEVLYIGARKVEAGVALADTPTDIAAALEAKINAAENMPCTASAALSELTLTFKNKGAQSNQIDVRSDYNDETGAPGITKVIAETVAGTVDPDLDTEGVDDIIEPYWFQAIMQPYQDDTNMDFIDDILVNNWAPGSQKGGVQFTAKADTYTNVQNWGNSKNSPFTCAMSAIGLPTPPEEYAAEFVAEVANSANIDPARPFQTLALLHTQPPVKDDILEREENEVLLQSGISTFAVNVRTVQIQRARTTYQLSAAGAVDKSYRDLNVVYTLIAIGYDASSHFNRKFPRHKLSSDGANFGEEDFVMTPKVGKSEIVALATNWQDVNGWIEGLDDFIKAIVVERNATDETRLDFKINPDIMNQFRIAGLLAQFLL